MEDLHTSAAPPEITLYPEHLREFVGPRAAPAAGRPATPALAGLAGLVEVERRLEELAGKLEYRYPLRPFPYHAEEMSLLHDAVDELRQVVATIARSLGML
jgi:hypothetical protein